MYYIQLKQGYHLETVDEFDTLKEAKKMLAEYRLGDLYSSYYISSRPCKNWKE